MKISPILDQIDAGIIVLPEFQRGFVWNRGQVRRFMQSLYHRYPVGSLLVWAMPTRAATTRGEQDMAPGLVKLLLDGQQRVTSLYGLVRGKPPAFFEGNARAFTDLRFHVDEETFAFYQPIKMRDDPLWIDVTALLQQGPATQIKPFLTSHPDRVADFLDRLNRIHGIKEIDLHIEEVTGEDKTIDVVVDIFNRINGGGTKLSKGDLALAKICAGWPEARQRMNAHLERWEAAGYHFRFELLLRVVTAVLTGEARFAALDDVDAPAFLKGLDTAAKHVDTLLNLIGSRLGLDHDRVFRGDYALPVMARYLEQRGGAIADPAERDKLLYWYIHCFLWGRHAGSTETVLSQDLRLIRDIPGGLDKLIDAFGQMRGDLRIRPDDFRGWSLKSRFYPLLYMLTRACQARDWETGDELKGHLLGRLSRLELHHIFPKATLKKYEGKQYGVPEINALANFTFLTQATNLKVSDRLPEEYLAGYCKTDPELLTSHWIPTDPELWRMGRYADFLKARRELLADAANDFLDTLLRGRMPEPPTPPTTMPEPPTPPTTMAERDAAHVPGGIAHEGERDQLIKVNQWVVDQGLPAGEFSYELVDVASNDLYGILDLAWPDGLQEGLSVPVALLLDEPEETEAAANRAGFRFFTDVEEFRSYVSKEILSEE